MLKCSIVNLNSFEGVFTLFPIILWTSSSGETGVVARSGLELLILLERDRKRLLGRPVAREIVAY